MRNSSTEFTHFRHQTTSTQIQIVKKTTTELEYTKPSSQTPIPYPKERARHNSASKWPITHDSPRVPDCDFEGTADRLQPVQNYMAGSRKSLRKVEG